MGGRAVEDGATAAATPALDHVDLVVSSVERSLPFYRDLLRPLGWTHEGEIEGERGERVWYLRGPVRGSFALGLRESPSETRGLPYDRYAVGVHHVAIRAPSREAVDERARWVEAQGFEIESGPKEYDYSPGYYAVFFYDPDGIKLELVHRPGD